METIKKSFKRAENDDLILIDDLSTHYNLEDLFTNKRNHDKTDKKSGYGRSGNSLL